MKKLFSYLSALVFAIVPFVSSVNAASITITNSVSGQTYSAYKIFDVTRNGDNYAYSIDEGSEWFNDVSDYATSNPNTFTLTKVGNTTKYVVTFGENFTTSDNALAFANYLSGKLDGKTADKSATADGSTTVLSDLSAGYYFVDSSLGALCILHTTADTVNVTEKNSEPTVEKEVSKPSASVGEVVTFTVTVTAGGKADTTYILHDVMTSGLTLDGNSFEITVGGVAVDSANYTIDTNPSDNDTFDITFNKEYTSTLEAGDEIVVKYSATVNEDAIVNSVDSNEAKLQYGNSTSQGSKVEVKNYDFDLVKTDENDNELSGARFKLYDSNNNLVKLVLDGTYYRVALEGETPVEYIEAGKISVKGLASGTYYLEEIKAPDGYNQLTERVTIDLTNGDLIGGSKVTVVNTTTQLLPLTGGMGTVLFITIGSMMVLLFGVLLVTKLRLSKMSI